MKIFFVTRRVPFPPDRGDKIATFHELRFLARNHEVHVFCLADGAEDLANVAGARRYAQSVTAIEVNPTWSKLRALRALLTGQSISVAMLRETALLDAITAAAAAIGPDLMLVYSSNVAQYAVPFVDVPRIMQFADLDSLKFQRYAVTSRPPMKWVYATEYRRLLDYERHVAATFSHSLVCTPEERRDFERLIPGRPVSIVGNGVDLDYFSSAKAAKRPGEIIFTGVMDYLPNVDAVTWFCDEILPLVQARCGEAHFTICGSRPTPAVLRLAERPGVSVTGRVEDIRPYLDRAEVFVAPLRIARGIQNKVVEALAMGLPVVASNAAWTGTGVAAGEGIVATDEPQAFAEHIVRILQDAVFRAQLSERARRIVARDFDWDNQLAELERVITAATASPRTLPS